MLAEVGWHFDEPLGDGVRLRPCSFRMAVGRAWNQRREGLDVDFCGLGDAEPTITIDGRGRRAGRCRATSSRCGPRAVAGTTSCATLLPPEGCLAVLGPDGPPLSFHDDPVTGVTLIHTETDSPDPDRLPHLVAHLTALRGRLLAEELIADPLVVR